jgi:hypothetical protein
LHGDNLGQGLADQFAPAGHQHQRPWQTGPTGQLRIGAKTVRFPYLHHAGQYFARIAVQVDEQRVRKTADLGRPGVNGSWMNGTGSLMAALQRVGIELDTEFAYSAR